jgi:hypothetical protein
LITWFLALSGTQGVTSFQPQHRLGKKSLFN